MEFIVHAWTINYIWFMIANSQCGTYTSRSEGNKSLLPCSSQFRKFFWLDALVPFKCQEHEVMLASINLVLGGMTVLMGKADKHQSASMGVDCNINTLFLNGQNENMNAQVWEFLSVNNGTCIPRYIFMHILIHFLHSVMLRECIFLRNHTVQCLSLS